jgi:hypothetical protein
MRGDSARRVSRFRRNYEQDPLTPTPLPTRPIGKRTEAWARGRHSPLNFTPRTRTSTTTTRRSRRRRNHEQDPLTPTPLPTRRIGKRTEAWGEGAPLTAQMESMRMAGSRRSHAGRSAQSTGNRRMHRLHSWSRHENRRAAQDRVVRLDQETPSVVCRTSLWFPK